ncbi:LAMI_0F07492g1_1 [Lachancea mirantina]|uniref:Ribosome biogenesis protein SLX9 n=1 Tax=Lachancea mirantina TaxID=1230905 RepID=A0A1G4JZR9_9SACH|nr:LAMI_0F07492g1_1 [Lachancea mirantina]
MVAKRRGHLRTKAAARLAMTKSTEDAPTSMIKSDIGTDMADTAMHMDEDPRAFLHQAKESKRDKSEQKSQQFLARIKESSLGAGISKSSLRRRKRKLRDRLKPRMDDLLVSLEQEVDIAGNDGKEENKRKQVNVIGGPKTEGNSSGLKKNQPSIRKQKGAKLLNTREADRFQTVLHNVQFQQSPFATLKEVIKMRSE